MAMGGSLVVSIMLRFMLTQSHESEGKLTKINFSFLSPLSSPFPLYCYCLTENRTLNNFHCITHQWIWSSLYTLMGPFSVWSLPRKWIWIACGFTNPSEAQKHWLESHFIHVLCLSLWFLCWVTWDFLIHIILCVFTNYPLFFLNMSPPSSCLCTYTSDLRFQMVWSPTGSCENLTKFFCFLSFLLPWLYTHIPAKCDPWTLCCLYPKYKLHWSYV